MKIAIQSIEIIDFTHASIFLNDLINYKVLEYLDKLEYLDGDIA